MVFNYFKWPWEVWNLISYGTCLLPSLNLRAWDITNQNKNENENIKMFSWFVNNQEHSHCLFYAKSAKGIISWSKTQLLSRNLIYVTFVKLSLGSIPSHGGYQVNIKYAKIMFLAIAMFQNYFSRFYSQRYEPVNFMQIMNITCSDMSKSWEQLLL